MTFKFATNLPLLEDIKSEDGGGGRLYTLPNGEKVPSITTVLGHFKKKSILEWRRRVGAEEANRISKQASGRGNRFHNLAEKYLRNEPLKELLAKENEFMRIQFGDAVDTLDRIDNIHSLEQPLYSKIMRIAGRTDTIAEFDGMLSVIDFKTSLREKNERDIQDYFQQATAYALMYKERANIPIQQIVVIISADGLDEPQVFVRQAKDYTEALFQKILQYRKETQ